MGTSSGLDAQLGYGAETTFGTPVTADHFIGFDSETLAGNKVTVQDNGLRAGQYWQRSLGRVITRRDAGGGFTASLHNAGGFGLLFKALLGGATNALHSGQTAVWDQVFTPSSTPPPSLTVQKGVPESSTSTVQPYTYTSYEVMSIDVSLDTANIAKIAVDGASQVERTLGSSPAGAALATAVYSATSVPLSFTGAGLTLGGSAVAAVKSMNLKITKQITTMESKTYIGGSGLAQAKPSRNSFYTVDGTMAADFTTRTALYDAYYADTALALVMTLGGPLVGTAGGVTSGYTFSVPVIKLNGEPPKVGGPDVVSISCPYEGFGDDTNPLVTVTSVTTDSAP